MREERGENKSNILLVQIINMVDRLTGMTEGLHKARSGLIRALLKTKDGLIEDIIISGDFIMTPENYADKMEIALLGVKAERETVLRTLSEFYQKNKFQCPLTFPGDFAAAIMKAVEGEKQ
jgi:hypothetical protein